MSRYICIHGHFYQPPRENPWLEEVELQDSAYPYHDWNERITAECYAPNSASRLLDSSGRIIDIVNNYSRISFNFGPTLLSWLERHNPEVYAAILEADRESRKLFSGHGSALAQVYNHMIMPLANSRDRRTQIIWGIKDFEHRFGRKPEGMWLAETAVDLETLDLMAEQGIGFTILAPRQAARTRRIGKRWRDVAGGKVDPRRPYICRLSSGRSINLFFYDGPISQDIAFGGLLTSGDKLASRLLGAYLEDSEPQLVHTATDGETFGHHHRFGEMALAYGLHHIDSNDLARITIYAEYLERNPPAHEVEIIENSSWSCVHGIERWRSNCGCNSGRQGWHQEWRRPLRESLDWLRDNLAPLYEREISPYIRDPWAARDDYVEVILDRSQENVERFLNRFVTRELAREEKVKVLRLLEMQRHAMLMYTSCGWFFDEISGIETTQVLQYAARAIQLAERAAGAQLEPDFLKILQEAPSNVEAYRNGARVYEKFVKPAAVDLLRVGAHYAISSLFEDYGDVEDIYRYTAHREQYDLDEAGRVRLATGMATLRSNVTWDEKKISFVVLHMGDHNLIGGVRNFRGEESFNQMKQEIRDALARSDFPETIRLMDKHFEAHNYSLWHLFRDEQRKVFNRILESTLEQVAVSFRQVYEQHYSIMQVMRELGTPIPKAFSTAAEFNVNSELRKELERPELDLVHLQNLIDEVGKWGLEVDRTTLGFVAPQRITALTERLFQAPEQIDVLRTLESMLRILAALDLEPNIWKAQNLYFSIARLRYPEMKARSDGGDEMATEWVEHFDKLGNYLQMRTA